MHQLIKWMTNTKNNEQKKSNLEKNKLPIKRIQKCTENIQNIYTKLDVTVHQMMIKWRILKWLG